MSPRRLGHEPIPTGNHRSHKSVLPAKSGKSASVADVERRLAHPRNLSPVCQPASTAATAPKASSGIPKAAASTSVPASRFQSLRVLSLYLKLGSFRQADPYHTLGLVPILGPIFHALFVRRPGPKFIRGRHISPFFQDLSLSPFFTLSRT